MTSNTSMAYIRAVDTVLPPHHYTQHEIREVVRSWLADDAKERDLLLRFLDSVQVKNRAFAVPVETLLRSPGVEERAAIFEEVGAELGVQAARKCLLSANCDAKEVSTVVFTSCTIPSIPAIDTRIINALGINPSVFRVPIYQYGCAGGAAGIALACKLAANGPALLVSVELCSLIFQKADLSTGNLVGSALFGDGAGAVLVDQHSSGVEVVDTRSFLVPNTQSLMGYNLLSDGPHLRLQRELPGVLGAHAAPVIEELLRRNSLRPSDISSWLIHPGGVRILNLVEETFGLTTGQTHWSWDVLSQKGNMSSASLLFVLDAFIRDKHAATGEYSVMLGVGPGLNIEGLLLKI